MTSNETMAHLWAGLSKPSLGTAASSGLEPAKACFNTLVRFTNTSCRTKFKSLSGVGFPDMHRKGPGTWAG